MRKEKPHTVTYAYKSGFLKTVYNGDNEEQARNMFEAGKKRENITCITWFRYGLRFLWYKSAR